MSSALALEPTPNKTMSRPSPIALLAALLFSAAAAAQQVTLQSSQAKALGIEVTSAGSGDQTTVSHLPARVTIPNEQLRMIAAPVSGVVETLEVAPGMAVRRGQILARLASPQALELQRDALQSASQSALLQQSLKRDQELFAEGLIAEARLQATRAAAAQAAAQARERREGLALAGIAPGKIGPALALTAPIDGVVLEQGAQVGQRVDASAMIYRIARLSPLWLEIQAPLELATAMRTGMTVKVAFSDVTGTLAAIGRSVDQASQTVLLRAVVDKGAERLTPGQVVEIELGAVAARGQRLPASALTWHEGRSLVFIQTGSDGQEIRFEARQVRVLSQGDGGVMIDGVQTGEKVVIRGVSGLKSIVAGIGRN
jgi:RND family efflux transporter MFP subunit